MKLFVASDHAAFELKEEILKRLKAKSILFEDLGTSSSESVDYPQFAEKLAHKVLEEKALGLLMCGSGVGMSIAANKIAGIRAACVSEPVSARLSREHNKANVLCLGSRICGFESAWACVEAFLAAEFDSSHPRHQRRIDQITKLELPS